MKKKQRNSYSADFKGEVTDGSSPLQGKWHDFLSQ